MYQCISGTNLQRKFCCHTVIEVQCDRRFRSELVSSSDIVWIPGQPVQALTLQRQAPDRVATWVLIFTILIWLDQGKYGSVPIQVFWFSLLQHSNGRCWDCSWSLCSAQTAMVALVVKMSVSRAEDLGFKTRLRRDFSGSSHTSDLKIGTPVATVPGAWRYRVSAGTG